MKQKNLSQWFEDGGDNSLRINYDLNEKSVVFDLGGYFGEWSEKIYNKYKCKIHIFEPIPSLFSGLNQKFSGNNDIEIYNFGMSDNESTIEISLLNDASSFNIQSENSVKAKVVSIKNFLIEKNINNIDLIKINIEGDEYKVLNCLLNNDLIKNFKNIQVQFHSFIPDAINLRNQIREKLKKTHMLTYDYEFVWENWELISNNKIFIQDDSFSHCLFSNNPLPPIQKTDKVQWDRSDNFKDSDYVIYTDYKIPYSRNNKNKDIAWLIEPQELQPSNYEFITNNYDKFFKIFTHDHVLLKLPNAVKIPFGGCWIKKEDFAIYKKSKNLSIICSNKKLLTGHKLRHECVNLVNSFADVYGNGYNTIQYKLDCLKDYKYQIVVENTKKDFWFTEKIIDCFVTGTIPIYYGCPSIGDFFNKDGILIFDSINELKNILENMPENLYEQKKQAIEDNFQRAKNFILAEQSISEYFNTL